jgi:signal-transduction protein with cAMP-binding, CBS, and nucleotidyltransferase domain
MKEAFAPRVTVQLPPDTMVTHPDELPELVHLNDPAMTVFTDFTREHPATIRPSASIDSALERMKHSAICVLLVIDEDQRLLGEIIADDIMGDKPVRMTESTGLDHSEITVKMLMIPRERIRVLEFEQLRTARVGHIIATLHALESRYVLVMENGSIRGLYAASQISRQLGSSIVELEAPAHSFAEIVHSLG